jgi:hypothetical protein
MSSRSPLSVLCQCSGQQCSGWFDSFGPAAGRPVARRRALQSTDMIDDNTARLSISQDERQAENIPYSVLRRAGLATRDMRLEYFALRCLPGVAESVVNACAGDTHLTSEVTNRSCLVSVRPETLDRRVQYGGFVEFSWPCQCKRSNSFRPQVASRPLRMPF